MTRKMVYPESPKQHPQTATSQAAVQVEEKEATAKNRKLKKAPARTARSAENAHARA